EVSAIGEQLSKSYVVGHCGDTMIVQHSSVFNILIQSAYRLVYQSDRPTNACCDGFAENYSPRRKCRKSTVAKCAIFIPNRGTLEQSLVHPGTF
ncbi:MAG: hypothetical protein ACHP79_04510, partial [Terriglobales bacterium]